MAGNPQGLNATVNTVHSATPLSDLTLAYRPSGGIADRIWPVKPVQHESDIYYKWNKGQRFRVVRADGQGTLIADKSPAKVRNFGFTTDSYKTQRYGAAESVSDRERANADAALSLEQSKLIGIQDEVMLDYEIRVATAVQAAANYAAANKDTLAGANQWNSASFTSLNTTGAGHSQIYTNLLTAKQSILTSANRMPNTIVIPFQVAMVVVNDPGLADMEKFTLNRLLAGDVLQDGGMFFGMRVLIPSITFQTTAEGEADSLGFVWGKNVILAYVDPAPGLNSLTFGLTFRVGGGFGIRSWREERTMETFYEASINQTEKLVSADCAYLISAAIA